MGADAVGRCRQRLWSIGAICEGDGRIGLESSSLHLQAEPGMFAGMPAEGIYSLLSRALVIAESIDNKQDLPDILGKFAYWRVTRGMGDFDQAELEYERGYRWPRRSVIAFTKRWS